MKELYGEGLASHTGPESCGDARESVTEALTGVHAGRPSSREIRVWGADDVSTFGRQHPRHRYARSRGTPRGPRHRHVWNLLVREPGGPDGRPWEDSTMGRTGKSKDARR
jgi:hypothetical protein